MSEPLIIFDDIIIKSLILAHDGSKNYIIICMR